MKVGLYGGTFDPIHFGHLHLAIEVLERCGLDEIWFCPAWISPHKLAQQPTPAHHRVQMVRLAIQDIPSFRLIEDEVQRQGPSYTIDTLHKLLQGSAKGCHLHLVLSDEIVPTLPRWRDVQELLALAPPLVGRRSTSGAMPLTGDAAIDAAVKHGSVKMPVLEIAATNVRQRLKKNLYCGHLVPEQVLQYIATHKLY